MQIPAFRCRSRAEYHARLSVCITVTTIGGAVCGTCGMPIAALVFAIMTVPVNLVWIYKG